MVRPCLHAIAKRKDNSARFRVTRAGYCLKTCDSSHTLRCLEAQKRNQLFRIINSERENSSDLDGLSETASFSTERLVLSGTFGRSNAVPGNRGKDRRVEGRDSKGPATARLHRVCGVAVQ